MFRGGNAKPGAVLLINWIATPRGQGWEVEPDAVVWLDVASVEASFSADSNRYVGKGGAGAGQRGRYNQIGSLIQSGRPVWMPHLSIDDDGALLFVDGRHRFAWVRDHGATALPVTTDPDGAAQLAAGFGTRLRECLVQC